MTAPINLQRHVLIERAVLVLAQRGESSVTLWTSIAAAVGYYDQAHLIADFHAIAGATPGAFLRELAEAI